MKAWHFLPADRELTNGDGRKVIAGEWLEVDGPPVPRSHGLHACADIMDAMKLARGPVIQRVEMGGEIVRYGTRIVATRRKCLWWIDADALLQEYTRLCALDVAHLLTAEGGPVRAGVSAATWDAACAAACAATRDMERGTGWTAAWDRAWNAARARQRRRLLRMVRAEHRRQEADR